MACGTSIDCAWTCPGCEPPAAPPRHDCGWIEGTFACRIRHQHMNTGVAKAAND